MIKRLVYLLLVLSVAVVVQAQGDSATPDPLMRDPAALAVRYLGFQGDTPLPPLTPIYHAGDQAQFWVGKADSETPTRVNATLAAAAANVYLWVEDGVAPGDSLAQMAQQLSQIVTAYRQRNNYQQATRLPGVGSFNDTGDVLPIPDVDNDPHLYILYTTNLSDDSDAIVNPMDSLPVAYAPYSNEHEMLYMDTAPYAGMALSDPFYAGTLARGIYRWIMNYNAPEQSPWLTEALDWLLLINLQQTQVDTESLNAFLQAPDTPLIQPATLTTQSPTFGGQQLFLAYFLQRYGSAAFNDLFMEPGAGAAPLDAVLAQHRIVDPVSGALVTGGDAFADFVMTNGLNLAFGDGRYVHRAIQLPQGQVAAATQLDAQSELNDLSVSQYGAQYFRYTPTQAATVRLDFAGSATVARLSMPADRDPADHFYWSGRAGDRDTTLTRAVDLSGVSSATLTFDAWYDLAAGWDYGYVSVSTDDGATWTPLAATSSSPNNRNGAAYGAGFTGISNPAGPRPFPTLGAIIASDGMGIAGVSPGGPADAAGIRTGDVIIGYDNKEWTGAPNILGMLANYAPGDTLHLYIQRGSDKLDVPLVLGAHPTRIVQPQPLWLAQSVDLTPYAGQAILLRFEAVTLPEQEDGGFAVDHIAIPAVGYRDDAESDPVGWTMDGWQQVDNQLPQRWIVQAATGGTQTQYPRVQMLIAPDSGASSGEWRIAVDANETLTIAISGASDDTTARATFNLGFKG